MNDKEIPITVTQRQLILGTLLGTSSIIKPKAGRNAYLQMRERKSGDLNWIRCKAADLSSMARPHAFAEDKDSWHWASVANPTWNKFQDLCYKDGKKSVSMEWLDQLMDQGLAVWFLDKGYKSGNQAHLRTAWFGEEGNNVIAKYFNEVGLECGVKCERNVRHIAFSEYGTIQFMKLILPKFPKYLLDIAARPHPLPPNP
jgi:hypothetical protein